MEDWLGYVWEHQAGVLPKPWSMFTMAASTVLINASICLTSELIYTFKTMNLL
jgi:hypothetical protein